MYNVIDIILSILLYMSLKENILINNEEIFKKYLKYKTKYLNMKKQLITQYGSSSRLSSAAHEINNAVSIASDAQTIMSNPLVQSIPNPFNKKKKTVEDNDDEDDEDDDDDDEEDEDEDD
jgi:hypothetical protein